MKRSVWLAAGVLCLVAAVGWTPGEPVLEGLPGEPVLEGLPDGVVLTLTVGPEPDEVLLRWTGGLTPFIVYRSTDRAAVRLPANQLGQTTGRAWIDAPPVGSVFYYELKSGGCASGASCASGYCVDSFCCSSACTGSCETCDLPGAEGSCLPVPAGQDPGGECGPGGVCDGLRGCLRQNGGACLAGDECLSGRCVDGVCCDTACSGECEQCDRAGSIGVCSAVPAGTDPHDDCPAEPPASCGRTGSCSGSRSCALHGTEVVCLAGTCASPDSANEDDVCDGSGSCADQGMRDCSPYVCGAGGDCLSSCATHADCSAGHICNTASDQCVTCIPGSDLPDLGFIDSNCDGIDGDVGGAIFVDASAGSDAAPGTMALPKRTIGAAILAAAAAGKDVYISKGIYVESPALADGVALYGGYDAAGGWTRGASNPTAIASPIATGVSIAGASLPIELQLLEIHAADAVGTLAGGGGRSSVGVLIRNSASVILRAVSLFPGDGAPGASGTSGGNGAAGGMGGNASGTSQGASGSSACGAPGGSGAAGVGCTGPGTLGGAGTQAPGGGAGASGGSGGGSGSCSGTSSSNGGSAPAVTSDGSPGSPGSNGVPGLTFGTLDPLGTYLPRPGGDASNGLPGGGGGGGGSGGGTAHGTSFPCTNCSCVASGAGGGGGGGGCGGTAGHGGFGGGGSFAIVVLNSNVIVEGAGLASRNGGDGGAAGDGGFGANGGGPGSGASGQTSGGFCSARSGGNGANGSSGGPGGRGGGGSGGTGGPSVCVAYVGVAPAVSNSPCSNGLPGLGGQGGVGIGTAPPGSSGLAASIVSAN